MIDTWAAVGIKCQGIADEQIFIGSDEALDRVVRSMRTIPGVTVRFMAVHVLR